MIENIMITLGRTLINRFTDRGYSQMEIANMLFDTDSLCREVKHYQLFGTKMGDEGYYIRYVQYFKDYINKFGRENIIDNENIIKEVMLHTLEDIGRYEHGFSEKELEDKREEHKYVIESKYLYYSDISKLLVENYQSPTNDEILNLEEHGKAFLLTTKKLEKLIEYIDTNRETKDEFLNVTTNMRFMLENKNALPKNFLIIMKEVGANNILKDYDMQSYYYPVILDLLLDIYRLKALVISEKEVYVLKNDLYRLDKALENNKVQMEKGMRGRIDLFSKIDTNQIIPYVIEKYANLLNANYEDIRKLYIYLAFGATSGHAHRYPKIKGKIPITRHLMFHHTRLFIDPK